MAEERNSYYAQPMYPGDGSNLGPETFSDPNRFSVLDKVDVPDNKTTEPADPETSGIFSMQPVFVNYGRVALDVVMLILLAFFVVNEVKTASKLAGKSINVHAMPIYIKGDIKVGDLWKTAMDLKDTTDALRVAAFQTEIAAACTGITTHPLCSCVAASGSSKTITQNCLLKYPQPSVTMDWNVGTISSAMIMWFVASLAASIGTLSYIETHITRAEQDKKVVYTKYNIWIVGLYVFLTIGAIVAPIISTSVLFSDTASSQKYFDSLWNMQTWSLIAIVSLGLFNCKTLLRYFSFSIVSDGTPDAKEKQIIEWERASVNNFIIYVHLLVSAPAIAMVLHLTQQWTDYSTIVNTTLILSTIFAVDAFSAEMSNYWASVAQDEHTHHHHGKEVKSKEEIANMHMRMGLIRMFAWVINLVMLVLLFTLAYPIEVEQQKINSAIFVVIVVAYGAVFLAPDLVREFTSWISFNSINFRLYGDFIVRAMTLFFVWFASARDRSA